MKEADVPSQTQPCLNSLRGQSISEGTALIVLYVQYYCAPYNAKESLPRTNLALCVVTCASYL